MLTVRGLRIPVEATGIANGTGGMPMRWHALNRAAAAGLVALLFPAIASGDARHVTLSSQTANVRVQTPRGARHSAVVVLASGAGRWRRLTSALGDRLSADGYAVISLDARSYVIEATRRSGGLAPAAVGEDYLAILRYADEWFPGRHRVFLLGVSEGAGLALVAAADPRVRALLAGVVGVETPPTVSLRYPYWKWTTWITHQDMENRSVAMADYVAAVAPIPVASIYGTSATGGLTEMAQRTFESGGEPRRLVVIGTDRPQFDDARQALFEALYDCFAWSTRVTPPSNTVSTAGGRPAGDTP